MKVLPGRSSDSEGPGQFIKQCSLKAGLPAGRPVALARARRTPRTKVRGVDCTGAVLAFGLLVRLHTV